MRNTLKTISTIIFLLLTFTTYAEESFSGVGLEIVAKDNNIIISSIIPNSPAERAGITPSLVIMKVDDKSTKGMKAEEVAHMIRGPIGSKVKLELFDLTKNKAITFEIIRDTIK